MSENITGLAEGLADGLGSGTGATGDAVRTLQDYLSQFGYLAAPPDSPYADIMRRAGARRPTSGEFDGATEAGLRRFQRQFDLPVTGMLDEATVSMMSRPRCGFPDLPVQRNRSAEAGMVASFVAQGNKWSKTTITYDIEQYSGDLSQANIGAATVSALRMWADVTPLTFVEASNPDIRIIFGAGNHNDGWPFDGPSGVLAHAFYPPPNGGDIAGDAHFDDAETWTVALPVPAGGIDLVTVMAHEFGHSLGLDHSSEPGALMYPFYGGPHRFLAADDVRGIQTIYGARVHAVPGWFGSEDQGADVAVASISDTGRPDLLVMHVDNPGGENHAYYRIGWDLDMAGRVTAGWSDIKAVPGWFGAEDQGAGCALADINDTRRPDLVVFHLDNPGGENHGYYRIGWNLDKNGAVTGGWSPVMAVPGWFGSEDQGAGVALSDVDRNGNLDLTVFHIDNPSGENHGYYRIGANLNTVGQVTGGWGPVTAVPGWFGAQDQGAGIATTDLNGTGRQDLIVFHVDNPGGENHGYYRVITDL